MLRHDGFRGTRTPYGQARTQPDAPSAGSRPRPRAPDVGTTLIELLIAIVVLGGAASVLLSGLATIMLNARLQDARATGHSLASGAEAVTETLDFVPCAAPAQYSTGLPDGVSVVRVETWDGASFRPSAEFSGGPCPDTGLQRLTVEWAAGGQVERAVVVKRRPAAAPAPAEPVLTVTAAPPVAAVGQEFSAGAAVSGPSGPPTGTVTFELFPTADCSGPAAFTSADRPLGAAAPYTATSAGFSAAATGTYHWRATYSGDGTYAAGSSDCDAAGATVSVGLATATVTVTSAPGSSSAGESVSATAVVAGPAGAPTGDVTFRLFSSPDCSAGSQVAESPNRPLGTSDPYTATSEGVPAPAPGTYHWQAAYGGDASYGAQASACNAAGSTVTVAQAVPTVSLTATPDTASAGQAVSAAVVVSGPAGAPAGTVSFGLFTSADCSGAPVHESPARPLSGTSPYTATAEEFGTTTTGTYFWQATYGGGGNYAPRASDCNAGGTTVTVGQAAPALILTAGQASAAVGESVSAGVEVSGPAGPPGGEVTFRLFAAADCSGSPVFESANRPLSPTGPHTAGSGDFVTAAPGTYYWQATYGGAGNYSPATTACGAAGSTVVVT